MKKSRHDLTQGNIFKNLLHLAVPIFLSNLLQDAFNIVDMIFVGRLGSAALAAVGLSGNLLRLIGVFALGISTGTAIMVAQFIGAKKRAEGEDIAMQALILCVVFAIGISCVGYLLAERGLRLMRTDDEEVIRLGVAYMQVTLLGMVTMFLSMTLNSIFRGAGDAVTPMIVLIFATVLNIILDPLLIFGVWKFPRLGVVGSAYATVIGRGVAAVIMFYLCFSGRGPISLKYVKRRINLSAMGQILRIGVFSSMQGFWRHLSRLGFMWVIGPYGKNAIAAYTVCMRLRVIVMTPGFGIANAISPMVGQNLGANQIDRAEKSAQIGNRVAIVMMSLIGILFFLFPQIFLGIFTNDMEVIGIGSLFLRYLSPTFGFIAISLVLGRALNGAGDTFSPMAITLICQVGVGLILVIAISYLIGLPGVWIGIALSNVLQGLMMWVWYRRGAWKAKKLVGEE